MSDYKSLIEKQRKFFYSGRTEEISLRIEKLRLLYNVIKENQEAAENALYKDLNKASFEAYETEIGIVLTEIRTVIKNLPKWAKIKKVKSPLVHFPSKSYIYSEPYGVVLIMAPWNYPFQLCLIPLVGAIAAGNCAVIKPSQYSPNTSKLVQEIIEKVFPQEYVAVIQGGREANTGLLEQKFDYIFFTGSPAVGHVVMEAAAKNLTPITLELGGKSPCIVDKTASVELAAKRIVWGKLINCGQTCIAPDYIIVHEQIKDIFIKALIKYIKELYGSDPLQSLYYPKIINEKHFNRLMGLIENQKIITGGCANKEKMKIAPTILDEPSWESPVMKEEIFGPIFPVLTYKDYNSLINKLKIKEKPLALYLFTTDRNMEKRIMSELSFGGGCVNDTLIHISNNNLPFGGVGQSGMGQYHCRASFDTFSHKKSVMKKSNLIDIYIRYPPFKNREKLLKKIMK